MPIYEYVCQDCKTGFEKLVMKSSEKIVCPSCGGKKSKQQLSVFRAHTGNGSSFGPAPGGGGGCGCTPSSCGCN